MISPLTQGSTTTQPVINLLSSLRMVVVTFVLSRMGAVVCHVPDVYIVPLFVLVLLAAGCVIIYVRVTDLLVRLLFGICIKCYRVFVSYFFSFFRPCTLLSGGSGGSKNFGNLFIFLFNVAAISWMMSEKNFGRGRKTIYQSRCHLSQMHTTDCMPFTRKKAAFF